MARKQWPYGSCVTNGKLNYLAPTTIAKADPNNPKGGGCLRKFYYRYVLGWKEPDRGWLNLGIACHAEIENYLITGVNTLGRITSATARFIPAPDPERKRLLIEHDIGSGSLATAKLRLIDVPVVGYTDVVHEEPAITPEGGNFDDPQGTIECLDWKFGSAKKGSEQDYSLSSHDLRIDTQMVTTGMWALRNTPQVDAPIRVSHVYTNTKGRAESSKATILMPRGQLSQRWKYLEGVARSIQDVAKESDVEKVPANLNACEAFGGCAYREKCTARNFNSLESFFGPEEKSEELNMGLIDMLDMPKPAPAVPPPSPTVDLGLGQDIASQMATFAAQPSAVTVPPGFAEAVALIEAKGYGMPALGGAAAKAYAAVKKYERVGDGYAGSGDLAKIPQVMDPDRLIGIAREIGPLPTKPVAIPPPVSPMIVAPPPLLTGVLPPDAPKSNPMIASLPVEGFAHPSAVTPAVEIPGLLASVPPAIAAPIVAAGAVSNPASVAIEPAEPKKRGRPAGKKPAEAPTENKATPESSPEGRWLFVNAIPNVAYDDLQRLVNELSIGMARHYKCEPCDPRMAPKDSPLGYGAWKGALTALARKAVNSPERLAPGAYYLDSRGSELNEAVFDGLRSARFVNPDGSDGDPVFDLIVVGR